MVALFKSDEKVLTSELLVETLKQIGAADCDILYIHSDVSFGTPLLKRKQLLQELYNCIASLGVKTVVFPTFTFSFCNHEVFDVNNSASKMGALNEYVRKNVEGVRTSDPLLSAYVVGDKLNLVDNLGKSSIGLDSNYDRLHTSGKNVKFLFLGADMRACFTYTHYMEAIAKVPYRYDKEFTGTIIDANGVSHENETYKLYSTYGNVKLSLIPDVHNTMEQAGMLHKATFGEGNLNCFSEKDAYKVILDLFAKDICFLTDGTFKESEKNTIYNPNNEKIVSVR